MSTLLVALLGVMLLPLFLSSWRMSLFGLCCQGLLMGWFAVEGTTDAPTADGWLTLFDLVVVRGLVAPGLLYGALRTKEGTGRIDVIPPNLLSWTLVGVLVLVGFNFAALLVPEAGDARQVVAVSVAGLLLAFFVLSSQSGAFSQMVGVLRFENAIALFELGLPHHGNPLLIHAGQSVVFLVTVGFLRWYLEALDPAPVPVPSVGQPAPDEPPEAQTL
jgi:hydrogenase-4 membrane subunit HyfE